MSATNNPQPVQYLRINQLCKKLNIGKTTVYDLMKAGKLPRQKKLGTCSVWIESEIDEAIARGAK